MSIAIEISMAIDNFNINNFYRLEGSKNPKYMSCNE